MIGNLISTGFAEVLFLILIFICGYGYMCFPISRIAITIQTRSMNEAEGPALLILIQLSHFERVGLINFQFPNLSSFQIYQCRSMKRNRISDCTALRFRRRQDRKGKNQNEYYGDDRNNIFLHELHLDNMSRNPLLMPVRNTP